MGDRHIGENISEISNSGNKAGVQPYAEPNPQSPDSFFSGKNESNDWENDSEIPSYDLILKLVERYVHRALASIEKKGLSKSNVLYPDTVLGQKIKKMRSSIHGRLDEKIIQSVGNELYPSFASLPIMTEYKRIKEELRGIESKTFEYKFSYTAAPRTLEEQFKEYNDLLLRREDLMERLKNLPLSTIERMKAYLSSIRQITNLSDNELFMGFVVSKKDRAKQSIVEAQKLFPKEWTAAFASRGKIRCSEAERGGFSIHLWKGDQIEISGGSEIERLKCAIHELGHRLEKTFSDVLMVEKEFYERRTKGEVLESFKKILGINYDDYDDDEMVRKDKFIHPYMSTWNKICTFKCNIICTKENFILNSA